MRACGLVVNPSLPWLGASPDGIVEDPSLKGLGLLVLVKILAVIQDFLQPSHMTKSLSSKNINIISKLNVLYHWSLNNQLYFGLYFGVFKCFLLSYHLKLPTSYYL